jgi:iron complex outermembrane receptor protein
VARRPQRIGRVSDTFRMRLAASKTNYDGTLNNLTTGGKLNGSKGDNLNAKFEWRPTDELTFTLTPHYNRTEKFCCTTAFTSMTPGGLYRNAPQLPQSVVLAGIDINPANRDVRNDYPTGGKFHDWGSGLKIDYSLRGRPHPELDLVLQQVPHGRLPGQRRHRHRHPASS